MTCILRLGGKTLDIDGFMKSITLSPQSLWRKGERTFPNSKSNQQKNSTSGIRVVASEADFSELPKQIDDVIAFLRQNHEHIKDLVCFPGVEGAVLDFGAEIYPPGWSSFTFPAELLELAGTAGVSLCLSVYPTEQDEEVDA